MKKFYDREREMQQLREMQRHLYRGQEVKMAGLSMEDM